MKKVISIVLALAMVLALGVCAFAAGTTITSGSITVDNAEKGQPYKVYKIFDLALTEIDGEKSYIYTINQNDEWYTDVAAYAADPAHGLILTSRDGGRYYSVDVDETKFVAADFATYLTGKTTGKTSRELAPAGDNKVALNNLPLGYYFVTSNAGALAALTTTNPDVTIQDKNDVPFEKTADDVSVEVGQNVGYTITGKVPDTAGFDDYVYVVTDTMTAGLTFNADVTITLKKVGKDDKVLVAPKDYTYTPGENGFTVDIQVMHDDIQEYVGGEIEIKYTAKVNEAAITKVDVNTATLDYGHRDATKEITKETKNYTAKVIIDKYRKGDEETKLAGAKFVLYKNVTTTPEEGDDAEPTTVKKYYKYDSVNKVVSWVDAIADATEVETDGTGAADFVGLEDGTYYLQETAAPEDYALLTAPIDVVINGADAVTAATAEAAAEILTETEGVENAPRGTQLPSTGGIGTTIFYIVGSILVVGAAIFLIVRRRMGAVEA